MKFNITTSMENYGNGKEMQKLKKLGFKFKKIKYCGTFHYKIVEPIVVSIVTLKELVALSDEFGEIVFSKNEIEIYNTHRE